MGRPMELVVIGAAALIESALVDRATRDVDVLAVRDGTAFAAADPLPEALVVARARIAARYGLGQEWLNGGPSLLIDFGLPAGFWSRLKVWRYGTGLCVWYPSRTDQIHFKLLAMMNQRGGRDGRHQSDMLALRPSPDELMAAARWTGWRMAVRVRVRPPGRRSIARSSAEPGYSGIQRPGGPRSRSTTESETGDVTAPPGNGL